MAALAVLIHAITPVHAGTGQGVDVIDQPIARERATQLPIIPGSSIKGVLRDYYEHDAEVESLFGHAIGSKVEFAGALQLSDARLLLLPVRSLASTFVWASCPFVLQRFVRDLKTVRYGVADEFPQVPAVTEERWLAAEKNCSINIGTHSHLILEDLSAPVQTEDTAAKGWASWLAARLFANEDTAWVREFTSRFAIIDDFSFMHLAEFATEVTAHIAINDETGTVDQGKLWYQEALPAESVLVTIVRAEHVRNPDSKLKDDREALGKIGYIPSIQFGGKSTTGHGMVRFVPLALARTK